MVMLLAMVAPVMNIKGKHTMASKSIPIQEKGGKVGESSAIHLGIKRQVTQVA